MSALLIRLFIRDPENTGDKTVRMHYGVLAGAVGIAANLLLCIAKFVIGLWSGSIAIQADAVNNLSDAGASVVTLIGFRAAGKPADREHPYGHARMEYIAALTIAFFILLVGLSLSRASIEKIITPTPVDFSLTAIGVLALSILIKFWMSRFSTEIGRRIHSSALSATTLDSLCDMASTGAILVSAVIGYFFNVNLDGYMGLLVALFVLYAGVDILRKTISPLMGEAPDPEVIAELGQRLLSYEGIIGFHDVLIHSYGPGITLASAHAEVPADENLLTAHENIDRAEREIGSEMGMLLTLHLDPIETDNEALAAARKMLAGILAEEAPAVRFHDFRMVSGKKQSKLVFDIVVPPGMRENEIAELKKTIRTRVRAADPRCYCVMDVDVDCAGRM